MKTEAPSYLRSPKTVQLHADLVVVGGGMAGTCCAITAGRHGLKVVLIQDRPVLGGNASSEVRLWILGATSHMGNNNRWAREGGVIDELLVENMYRNPEGNALILDTILLEKVTEEPNITLLLNTVAYEVEKASDDQIRLVRAFCSQNSTQYEVTAPFFCDASGDGILGFLSGAAFRMGAEAAEEFDEPFAPTEEYGELLGHSIYFMTKDVGKPVRFIAPSYALKNVPEKIPRYRKFNTKDFGAHLWWIEYGGRMDTVHESETIKWELWKVVYGVWDYIKNSGNFPDAETMTLEWVGLIPGKRESRRFEGPYLLKQSDIVRQTHFPDTVSFGGWAIDLHPADGVFSEKPGCNQWHSKGVYRIPFRTMFSRNIHNLFITGRILSATHVAMGSTRVMATCSHNAQAVALAAVLAQKYHCLPRDLVKSPRMEELQQELLKSGQYIPSVALIDHDDLCRQNNHSTSSDLILQELPFDGEWQQLIFSSAQLLPMKAGSRPTFTIEIQTKEATRLTATLRVSSRPENFTPDITLEKLETDLKPGTQKIELPFSTTIPEDGYVFICLHKNEAISVRSSNTRISGILTVYNKENRAVSNFGRQQGGAEIGFEDFEFWVPVRRPGGQNFAMNISPALNCFGPENLKNGIHRPCIRPNAWVADPEDEFPELVLKWDQPQNISRMVITFDTDLDHPMESSIWGHPETVMPFTVRDYEISNDQGEVLFTKTGNYLTRNEIQLEKPTETTSLTLKFKRPSENVPVSVFEIRCYT